MIGCYLQFSFCFGRLLHNTVVVSVLSKYGKVHHITRERYGIESGFPILNGVRGAHVELSKAVPDTLHVQHFPVRVAYDGMVVKCFKCNSPDHIKAKCPKRTLVQKSGNSKTFVEALLESKSSTKDVSEVSESSSEQNGQEASSNDGIPKNLVLMNEVGALPDDAVVEVNQNQTVVSVDNEEDWIEIKSDRKRGRNSKKQEKQDEQSTDSEETNVIRRGRPVKKQLKVRKSVGLPVPKTRLQKVKLTRSKAIDSLETGTPV